MGRDKLEVVRSTPPKEPEERLRESMESMEAKKGNYLIG